MVDNKILTGMMSYDHPIVFPPDVQQIVLLQGSSAGAGTVLAMATTMCTRPLVQIRALMHLLT